MGPVTLCKREPAPVCRQLHQGVAAWCRMAVVARAGVSQRIVGGRVHAFESEPFSPLVPPGIFSSLSAGRGEEGGVAAFLAHPVGALQVPPQRLSLAVLRDTCSIHSFILQMLQTPTVCQPPVIGLLWLE